MLAHLKRCNVKMEMSSDRIYLSAKATSAPSIFFVARVTSFLNFNIIAIKINSIGRRPLIKRPFQIKGKREDKKKTEYENYFF